MTRAERLIDLQARLQTELGCNEILALYGKATGLEAGASPGPIVLFSAMIRVILNYEYPG